ncbi:zinc finger phd-type protein [Stemphylium lycopersici]|uniref:Zinc finger phd-type protein n=1 Tax=Stemphylium lycopersici TaxID=183478 RepID=A0A364NFC7_STELY|nr:zinc finger phd-type protein [Stemphylium lycopersici]
MVIALITISGGIMAEGKLDRALRRMNAEQSTPVGSKDKALAMMVKDGYIVRIKDASGAGDETVDYIVGPRGRVDVGRHGVARFLRAMHGEEEDEAELERRIQRTLNVAEAHNNSMNNTDTLANHASEMAPTEDAADALTSLATLGAGHQHVPADETSPQPFIKHEPSATPRSSTPGEDVDADTLKALEIAKQTDLGLRRRNQATLDAPAPSKKRPAPASASASSLKKKGTAKTSKPNKKRRVDNKPAPKASQAGTPAPESSPAPDYSSQPHASDDDGESSEDHNLYCLCKKPDNHRWMIGCDGGCDDWFHGDCVNMKQADEELVDKFICPLCEENGIGHTTWKPMCRRDGCRKPARPAKDDESKYCSDDCGLFFMSEQLQRTAGAKGLDGPRDRSRQGKKNADTGAMEDEEPMPLGGTLRTKDLKALVDASPNVQAFKTLGTGVLTPPQTASPSRSNFSSTDSDLTLTPGEIDRLTALHKERLQLKDRLEVLKDREKFVSMAKEQAVRLADREKIKAKDFCGYDSRMSWSDAEFTIWRNSSHGRAAFEHSTLSPAPEQLSSLLEPNAVDAINEESRETVCLKKRCQKHPQWQKLNLQDARFEELEIVEAIKECDKDERAGTNEFNLSGQQHTSRDAVFHVRFHIATQ